MRKVTFGLLVAFVFSLPSENIIVLDAIGTISRLIGAAAIVTGVFAVAVTARLRRPGLVFCLALVFTLLNVLSLFWTISAEASFGRVVTYAQLAGLTWLIWEFVRTPQEQESLMVAYCLGAYLPIADVLWSFSAGDAFRMDRTRYSSLNQDPNDLGVTLAIGIPLAWQLFQTKRGIIRVLGAAYIPFAVVCVLLTASRGAFLALLVALSIVPLTLLRSSIRSVALVTGVLLVVAVTAALIVPQYSWNRILTTPQEIADGGTMGGRLGIWRAGLRAFDERPLLGAGAGAFSAAVEPLIGRSAPHNVYLAILVEQGIVGSVAFGLLLGVCGWFVCRLPLQERKLWGVIGLTWFVGGMSLGWQYYKITWLMFGLLATQAALATAGVRDAQRSERRREARVPSTLEAHRLVRGPAL